MSATGITKSSTHDPRPSARVGLRFRRLLLPAGLFCLVAGGLAACGGTDNAKLVAEGQQTFR
ncbi:MAG: hypothetical protein ACM3PC_00035, partial [Deltaproteobacteria bacterium]